MDLNIKFSHSYPKLHNQTRARLLNVEVVDYYDLNPDLIAYDTVYGDGEYYPLPKTRLLHLTFLGDKLIPFSTIRRYNQSKEIYYGGSIGEVFNIIVGGAP